MIFGFSLEFVIGLLASSFLVIVIVSDFNYLIISDEVTLFFSIVSILFQLVLGGWQLALSSVLFGAFLFFLMYFIMLLGNKIMQEEALGGGDDKNNKRYIYNKTYFKRGFEFAQNVRGSNFPES